MTSCSLDLVQIEHSYQATPVLKGVSLEIPPGEFFCLLGPSGGGKTTLLNSIAGLITPASGRVVLDGKDITDLPLQRRDIGIVFQSYALFPHMTVADNIAYGLRIRKKSKAETDETVKSLLALVRLEGKGDRRPRQLSGGEQQRVAVARALALDPKLLLLDEPLSNLDAKLRDELGSELRRVQQVTGVTTMLVTHDQDEAFALADRVGVINGGRLAQIGSPEELYSSPDDLFVADFIGESNKLDGTLLRKGGEPSVSIGGAEFACLAADDVPAGRVIVVIRPHKLRVTPPDRRLVAGESGVTGTIRDTRFQGAYWRYEIDSEIGPLVANDAGSERRFARSDSITLTWRHSDAIAFRRPE